MSSLPAKIREQIRRHRLPESGACPFRPRIVHNQRGDPIIDKKSPSKGKKSGKKGYVDDQGRIWIRDYAHATYPEHWDVQIDDGEVYLRVDNSGNLL